MIFVIIGRQLGVSRRLNIMRLGPSPSLRRAEAATMSPALLGRRTAAGMILAGKGNAVILDMSGRKRNPDPTHGERHESQAGPELVGQPPPQLLHAYQRHGLNPQ